MTDARYITEPAITMDAKGHPRKGRKSAYSPPRTIGIGLRGPGRFARLRLLDPDRAGKPVYDAELTRELLARTCEMPSGRPALVAMLTEYRHALHDLVVGPHAPFQD